MKQHIYNILSKINGLLLGAFCVTLVMGFTSCGDFFDESSQDEIKPSTVEDLSAVLYADAYPYNVSVDDYLILLTDEVQCNGLKYDGYATRMQVGQQVFCYNPEMFDGIESFIADENSWKEYYKLIKGCNVILDYADDMAGDQLKKQYMKGQARFLRAYYYLRLAMIYCQPFNNGSPDVNLGVPLITSSHVTDQYPTRSTLRQAYNFIESELMKAAEELDGYVPTTKYRVTKTPADVLLSRLYLYEEKWENCVEYATKAISEGPELTDFDYLKSKYRSVYDCDYSTEVVWNYAGKACYSAYFDLNQLYNYMLPWSASSKVVALYDQTNDLRSQYLYVQKSASTGDYITKASRSSTYDGDHGIRMAEAYLNRAEAYARLSMEGKGDIGKGLDDINTLRETRYKNGTYTPVAFTESSLLLDFILEERQRELIWEDGFRWMDIKRLGLSVTHTYTDANGMQTDYVLKSNDLLYALPIPNDALLKNKNLIQNPR